MTPINYIGSTFQENSRVIESTKNGERHVNEYLNSFVGVARDFFGLFDQATLALEDRLPSIVSLPPGFHQVYSYDTAQENFEKFTFSGYWFNKINALLDLASVSWLEYFNNPPRINTHEFASLDRASSRTNTSPIMDYIKRLPNIVNKKYILDSLNVTDIENRYTLGSFLYFVHPGVTDYHIASATGNEKLKVPYIYINPIISRSGNSNVAYSIPIYFPGIGAFWAKFTGYSDFYDYPMLIGTALNEIIQSQNSQEVITNVSPNQDSSQTFTIERLSNTEFASLLDGLAKLGVPQEQE